MNAKKDKKGFVLPAIIILITLLTAMNVNAASKTGKLKSSVLAQVDKPHFSASGTVTWANISNAKNYQVQLYRNGTIEGSPKTLTSGKTGLNFLQIMRSLGPGRYTVKVKAVGDGKLFKDGLQSMPSDTLVIKKLNQIGQPNWTADTINWPVSIHAAFYEVKLYKNDKELSTQMIPFGKTSFDFKAVIDKNMPGTFMVTVKAKGSGLFVDGPVSKPSGGHPKTIPLKQVKQPKLSEFGVATWLDVPNAKKYEVQLFKNGIAQGISEIAQTGSGGYDFLSMMRTAGEGEYTVKVKAKGDGHSYTDGIPSIDSAVQVITKAVTVKEINLSASGIAAWTNTNGTSYDLRLYKNGVIVDIRKGAASGYNYLNTMRNNGAGMYAITVTAKSSAGLIIDGDESMPSEEQPITVPLKQAEQPMWEAEQPIWGPRIISWTPVANAVNYVVKLYKNGGLICTQTTSFRITSFDFSTIIFQNSPGAFTVTVQAKGLGVYSDGPVSKPSSRQDDLMLVSGFNITNVTYDDGCSGYKLQIDRSKLPSKAADFAYMAWFLPNELDEFDFQRFLKDVKSSNSMTFLLQNDEFCWNDYTQYDVFMLLDKDMNLLGYYIYDK